jgi:hypothetical protein
MTKVKIHRIVQIPRSISKPLSLLGKDTVFKRVLTKRLKAKIFIDEVNYTVTVEASPDRLDIAVKYVENRLNNLVFNSQIIWLCIILSSCQKFGFVLHNLDPSDECKTKYAYKLVGIQEKTEPVLPIIAGECEVLEWTGRNLLLDRIHLSKIAGRMADIGDDIQICAISGFNIYEILDAHEGPYDRSEVEQLKYGVSYGCRWNPYVSEEDLNRILGGEFKKEDEYSLSVCLIDDLLDENYLVKYKWNKNGKWDLTQASKGRKNYGKFDIKADTDLGFRINIYSRHSFEEEVSRIAEEVMIIDQTQQMVSGNPMLVIPQFKGKFDSAIRMDNFFVEKKIKSQTDALKIAVVETISPSGNSKSLRVKVNNAHNDLSTDKKFTFLFEELKKLCQP